MTKIQNAKVGQLGLIQQSEDGTITQIGLTPEQSQLLQVLVGSFSSVDKPLLRLPREYNLKVVGNE